MPAPLKIQGQIFNRLTVVKRMPKTKWGTFRWRCICTCGNQVDVIGANLRNGNTQSCGCFQKTSRRTHGHMSGGQSDTYTSWRNAITRCYCAKHESFSKYGGAGITVCDRWKSFANFLEDMGERPKGTTLGRHGDIGNYEPGNCSWQTWKQQGDERRQKNLLKKVA